MSIRPKKNDRVTVYGKSGTVVNAEKIYTKMYYSIKLDHNGKIQKFRGEELKYEKVGGGKGE
ncbi:MULTISPECIES: hypothetical protein [Paenibacillus]|uniref:hypothetical protein n=1 Tax=Paenibacillus TaxID=44249 RepID=UPI00142E6E4D|nr:MULTISPECIES: hypothetical protein [unclassified Paenibacillus]MEE4577838.1 hypothetical protein [Paenibacillus polymyxa]KAF6618285.1 hypothetical protein HFE00_09390 [Paenibacillus sp. EKM101P]KAF6624630.1 hypothetical protein HFE03_03550 [Paenibacillus sp. EKM102P]KAF6635591.1 hypothetical protein HFE01_01480 [Paenibacillus sp. EKM10P]KAF6648699.1 hypothetical protein HFE02_10070 [Paenibacillus sp. EKM11P]